MKKRVLCLKLPPSEVGSATGDRITKRKDGRYMARYTVQTADGPKRKTIYGRNY